MATRMTMMRALGRSAGLASLLALTVTARGTDAFDPPRLLLGVAPPVAARAVGGGVVLIEARVNAEGSVVDVRTLASLEPYTKALRRAVQQFRFRPAHQGEEAASARVLVAGCFRPPSLLAIGGFDAPRAPADVRVAWPTAITPPAYPPTGQGDAAVIVDVRLSPDGTPVSARVIESAPGFDETAVAAARAWRFRVPSPEAASAVLVFVFREPVALGAAPR